MLLAFFSAGFGQQIKLTKGHENNPYYSSTDTHTLNVSNAGVEKDIVA